MKLKFLFALLLAATTAVCKSDNLLVGTGSGYSPYVSLNAKGEYEGFDIDVAHLIAERLHKKLVLKDLGSLPSLLVALKKNKIDTILWAISITEEREKELEMIYYQGERVETLPFLFWNQIPPQLAKIEDFSQIPKCIICVEAGSYQDAVIQKYPQLQVRFLDKITDAIMELKYGKAMATTIDPSLIDLMQRQYPELKVVHLPLPQDIQSMGNGICMNKTNQELSREIRKVVQDLRAEGKIAELEKKWKLSNHD